MWNDLERNQRQQDFMVATLKRAVEKGIRNPLTLRRVANELLDDDNPSITWTTASPLDRSLTWVMSSGRSR